MVYDLCYAVSFIRGLVGRAVGSWSWNLEAESIFELLP